ncbi:MAG: hypothetical protein ABW352_19580 [Polyangiales bacterium]
MTTHDSPWDGPRRALPWPAIAIADTARGLDALGFALALGEAAHDLRVPVRFHLLDFEREPALPSELAPRFAAAGSVQAQRVSGEGVAVAVDASALELWVGLPALASLAPAFGVLLGVDRPRLEWPALLRGVQVALALTGPRPGLARTLLEELNRRGFLPAGDHGVR